MKRLKLLFLLFFIFGSGIAQRPDENRSELLMLLKERKELYDQYSKSLNEKSGFFGNRTKNDLKSSQEKLLEIIAVDNKIMNTLNRSLDYRNFEKQTLSYDVSSFENRIRNLNKLNDTLNKQNLKFASENKSLQKTVKKYHLYFVLLILLLLLTWGKRIQKMFGK